MECGEKYLMRGPSEVKRTVATPLDTSLIVFLRLNFFHILEYYGDVA